MLLVIDVYLGKKWLFPLFWLHLTDYMINLSINPVTVWASIFKFVFLSCQTHRSKCQTGLCAWILVLKSHSLFVFPVKKSFSFSGGSFSGGILIAPCAQHSENYLFDAFPSTGLLFS